MAEKLLVSLDKGIKRITFNNPERRNAVDAETAEKLFDAFRESHADGTRVVILTGAGDAFCAGADLAARSEREIAEYDVTAYLREVKPDDSGDAGIARSRDRPTFTAPPSALAATTRSPPI